MRKCTLNCVVFRYTCVKHPFLMNILCHPPILKGNRCTKIVYSKYGYSVETNWIAMSEGGHIWSQSPTFQFPTFYCDNKSDCTVLQKYWPVLSKCVRCYKRSWPSGPVQAKLLQEKLTCRSSLDQKDRKVNFSCSNFAWTGPDGQLL